MAQGYLYLGEAAGGRILRYGTGFTQIGTAYQLQARTWDFRPAGRGGKATFRTLTALVRHTQGYNVRVTPIVDDVVLPARTFSSGPPSGGRADEVASCVCGVHLAGNHIAALFETLSLLGETELVDLVVSPVVVRVTS